MWRLRRVFFLLIFFTVGIFKSDEVDFGECELAPSENSAECPLLEIDCQNPDSLTGFILSPDYPNKVTDTARYGKYSLVIITSCEDSTITLTLSKAAFLLGPIANTFTVRDGEDVDSNVIEPTLNATIWNLGVTENTLDYNSSGNSIWMEANVSWGNFWFNITYSISINVNEQTTIEPTSESTYSTDATSEDTTTESTTTTSEGTTTTVPTTTSSTSTTTSPNLQKPCNQTDPYGVRWTSFQTEKLNKTCSEGVPGANGISFWTCNCTNPLAECAFETSQPDFSGCSSKELETIIDSVDYETKSVTEIWVAIENFTSQENKYYGQEIFPILIEVVTALLDRMQSEMNGTVEYLDLQINSSYYATATMDHLITNDIQWDQLVNQTKGYGELLTLLEVSNDISFHLSNVSKAVGMPLFCEIPFNNVTISSSYWNGSQSDFVGCNLKTLPARELSLTFPNYQNVTNEDGIVKSYILLPNGITERAYKASGVLIAASNLIKKLLPGSENSQGIIEKEVNSPLISYTFYDLESEDLTDVSKLPDGSYVQIVLEHFIRATYPPVRTIRRSLEEGEVPSTVIGSSLCSYLVLNPSKTKGVPTYNNWTWDDQGCRAASTNRTHTVCLCNHLTGFANLMDFHDYIKSPALDTTSMFCSILSIVCLALTLAILTMLKSLKMNRTFSTQNLCATLLISHLMILITLDKKLIDLDDVTCAVMGIFLHYILLVSFMWMFIEGFQLYRMAVNVFGAWTKRWTLFYIIVAYTVPLVIVLTTIIIASSLPPDEKNNSGIVQVYSGDETCWLVGEQWMWAFGGPIAFIIIGNCRFVFVGISSSCKLHTNSTTTSSKMIQEMTLRVISLTTLLGLTWMFGFLLYSELIIFAYIFTIANGLQGVFIFIDRCILNKKIRNAIPGTIRRLSTRLNIYNNTSGLDRTLTHISTATAASVPRVNSRKKKTK